MIVDTFRWMYDVFKDNNVSCIVNCGDLFDSYRLKAEEISAMAEALSYNTGIPEFHVLGNHEILDKRRDFYATALLDNYSNIEVINTPTKTDMGISFLPYMSWEDARDAIPFIKNRILFSHVDIEGSRVTPQYLLDSGVESCYLSECFNLVINGHIHGYQKLRDNVYNIGATASLSFSDSEESIPGIAIIDTDSLRITRIPNPYAIRFISAPSDVGNIYDSFCDNLEKSGYRYVVRAKVAEKEKPEVENLFKSCDSIVSYRIQTIYNNNASPSDDESGMVEYESKSDINSSFVDFLNTCEDLKFPLQDYIKEATSLTSGGQ